MLAKQIFSIKNNLSSIICLTLISTYSFVPEAFASNENEVITSTGVSNKALSDEFLLSSYGYTNLVKHSKDFDGKVTPQGAVDIEEADSSTYLESISFNKIKKQPQSSYSGDFNGDGCNDIIISNYALKVASLIFSNKTDLAKLRSTSLTSNPF